MRILVGTLYCIENELDECVAALKRQTHQEFEQFVIEGLPNREAHHALYGTFMARTHEFDLFMKVDADMVIENTFLFAQIVEKFCTNSQMHQLTIAVQDYFSDSLIDGMHTYRNSVKWDLSDDIVYTDRHPVAPEHKVIDTHELAPAAVHCKNPSPFQAFHYGMHRGVKAKVYVERRHKYPQIYMRHIDATWRHFLNTNDLRLGLAALSAELAIRGDFKPEHIAYTNPFVETEFKGRYANWGSRHVRDFTRLLRIRNRLLVPYLARRSMRSITARLLPGLKRVRRIW